MTSTTEYKALFNPENIQTVEFHKKAKSETIKMKHASKIRLNCFGLGLAKIDFTGDNNLPQYSLPLQDIISTKVRIEKKRFGQQTLLAIETANGIIDIEKMSEKEIAAFEQLLDIQKEKMVLGNKSKKITFTSDGSTKTLTICPYSPTIQDGEEVIYSTTLDEVGYLVTNYRVWENHFFEAGKPNPLTHEEYDEVIATNVERRMESTTSVDRKQKRTKLGMLSTLAIGGMTAPILDQVAGRQLRGLKTTETHKSSSTETEIGNIVFMKDGKRVMVWENFPDPNSTVNLINSAKAHFSTTPTASSSKGEDPIKALKLRFAKGEITKEEFLEMKSLLE